MSDNLQTLREDLDYMKALAREGRHAPLLGGAVLVIAGLSFGTASLAAWLIGTGVVPVDTQWINGAWAISGLVFMAGLFTARSRYGTRPGALATNNRAVQAVWMGSGWAIFAFAVAIAGMAIRQHAENPVFYFALFAPFILSVYGISWTVAAVMSGKRWIWTVALSCYAAAVGLGWMGGTLDQFLAYAAALYLLAALPGFLLMRGEPSDVI